MQPLEVDGFTSPSRSQLGGIECAISMPGQSQCEGMAQQAENVGDVALGDCKPAFPFPVASSPALCPSCRVCATFLFQSMVNPFGALKCVDSDPYCLHRSFQASIQEVDVSGESSLDGEWMAYLGGCRHLRALRATDCKALTNNAIWQLTGTHSTP